MSNIINEKIGVLFLNHKYTRDTLANELGITRPTLTRRLKGQTDWRWCEVRKIAELTGSTLAELADEHHAMP